MLRDLDRDVPYAHGCPATFDDLGADTNRPRGFDVRADKRGLPLGMTVELLEVGEDRLAA
ncbi:MAG TPA: hypothetical protein VGQ02_00340 [Candidatus Limnocylindrales bacterium]|nr:hypothetical protein [Candidatus Limnocylindrales bacterium]